MRTIGTGQNDNEKKQRMARNFCIFMLVLLIFSSLGYAFLSNPSIDSTPLTNSVDSGVRQVGERWVFGQTGREISLAFGPEETKNITVWSVAGLEQYVDEPLFFDITNQGILTEVANALQQYPSRMQEACYGSCERDLPEKDCSENMIVWRESNSSLVRQENRCVFIEGDLRAADAFIYELFGISRESI